MQSFEKSKELLERELKVSPLAAQTYSKSYRYFCSGIAPSYMDHGEGCYIYETMLLFRKTVGIMKSWQAQLTKDFSDEHFAILASFDDGSALIEESAPYIGFTLRFWKIREGQGPDENIDFDQPLLKIII